MPDPPKRRGYLLPGAIALGFLVAAAVALSLTVLAPRGPSGLAGADIEPLIAAQLQSAQRSSASPQVTCPASEPLRRGLVFYCHATEAGRTRVVKVTETTGNGALHIQVLGRPSGPAG